MNGILNVYKEKGFTSFDVVAKLRGILKEKKIGHTGTLDPDATGVLPVCIGNATKVCALLTDQDKEYVALMHLGIVTDTLDATGRVLQNHEEQAHSLEESEVRAAIESFIGTYDQMPPMYSALKVNGKKLCDLARAGVEVERKPRPVTIYAISIEAMELPLVRMKIHCSKGTYIRSLCADIGEKLGVGACMDELVRTKVSNFLIDDAYTIAQIEQRKNAGTLDEILISVAQVFDALPALSITSEAARRLQNGNRLFVQDFKGIPIDLHDGAKHIRVRVYDETDAFAAIYEYNREEAAFLCEKMFKTS
ncbi:MAG: tRNA pseudouridine(55) synthase TruB [bacterium]|nr:tRNA pseudouridine(55) synthase TruB [bacterium]